MITWCLTKQEYQEIIDFIFTKRKLIKIFGFLKKRRYPCKKNLCSYWVKNRFEQSCRVKKAFSTWTMPHVGTAEYQVFPLYISIESQSEFGNMQFRGHKIYRGAASSQMILWSISTTRWTTLYYPEKMKVPKENSTLQIPFKSLLYILDRTRLVHSAQLATLERRYYGVWRGHKKIWKFWKLSEAIVFCAIFANHFQLLQFSSDQLSSWGTASQVCWL